MGLNTFMTASVMKELNAFKTIFTNRDSFFPYWSIIITITNVWQIVQLENKGMFSDTFKEAIHKSNLRSFEVQIHRKKSATCLDISNIIKQKPGSYYEEGTVPLPLDLIP